MDFSSWLDQGYGRVAITARALNVSSPRVSAMKRTGVVPAEHAPAIEELTGGAVTCEEMRPDVKWHVLRNSARPVGAGAEACAEIRVIAAPDAANDAADARPGRA